MAFLTRTLKAACSFLPFQTPQRSSESLPSQTQSRVFIAKRSASDAFSNQGMRMRDGSPKKRRKFLGELENQGAGRIGSAAKHSILGAQFEGCDQSEVQTVMESHGHEATKTHTDKRLMPPPVTPPIHHIPQKRSSGRHGRKSIDNHESASQFTRSSRVARNEIIDEYDMEEARRRAAATQLPANSGVWEVAERELFFHLSYRGFEPLLPHSWMIDFPTLPLSVFAHQSEDVPLIECHRSTSFRASKALSDLLETGTAIRDRNIASKDLRSEPILEKSIRRYTTWALQDLGLPTKASSTTFTTPVYTVACMKRDETTSDVLHQLAIEMHTIAEKHRAAMNVHSSIEGSCSLGTVGENATIQVHTDPGPFDLPVIYGITICYSIMTIFTLNGHTPVPPFVLRSVRQRSSNSVAKDSSSIPGAVTAQDVVPEEIGTGNEDSGLRYIADFDFSDATRDVWNSFVIAIVAMQIRKTMAQSLKAKMILQEHERDNVEAVMDESWLSNIEGEGMDNDGSYHPQIERNIPKGSEDDDDDPDA